MGKNKNKLVSTTPVVIKQQKKRVESANPDIESKTFIDSNQCVNQNEDARRELAVSIVSLLSDFRDSLPQSSERYFNALQTIIVSLNAYIRYEENHIGVWNGYEHLAMAYTAYTHLMYCTRPRDIKRDSKIRETLHLFLKESENLWHILLSQYIDFETKH